MGRLRKGELPRICRHRASGQAVARLEGKDHYLGPYGSKAAQVAYDDLVAAWLNAGRRLPPATGTEAEGLTVAMLIDGYWTWAKTYYRKPDGSASSELSCIKVAVTELRKLAGNLAVRDFGPLRLQALQNAMIARGWARRSINLHASRVRRIFAWGVAQELVPSDVLGALKAVSGLKAGRSNAHETPPIQPVADAHVEKTIPFLTPPVAAAVRLMALTGMRVSEAASMRMADIDRTDEVWIYRPASHKTAHRGRGRVVPLGPQAQEVLRPFLRAAPNEYLFTPAEGDAAYRAQRRERRVSPLRPVDLRRQDKRGAGKCRRFAKRYDKDSIGHAIRRACKLAGVAEWHAHQLRHTVATKVQRQHGLDAARALLGHATPDVTAIYAERDQAAASRVMAAEG